MSIDVKNTKWAVYRKSTKQIISRNVQWPRADGKEIVGLDDDIVYLLIEYGDKPDYNPFNEKLIITEKVNLRTSPKKLQFLYEKVDLTTEEKDKKTPTCYETFIVTPSIKLNVSEQSQNAFSRLINMIALTEKPNDEEITIKDIYNQSHVITIGELKTILQEYGEHCYSLFVS